MTNALHEDGGKRPPEEMRLRSSRPPVTRLSRRVLLSLAAAAAIGVAGALFFALKPQHQITGSELYNTNGHDTPDGLANLPRDYAGLPKPVPQLGPPLPGDLGPPIAAAGAPAPGMPTGVDPEQQRIAQEREAARVSHLFATSNVDQTAAPSSPTVMVAQAPASPYVLQAGSVIPAALISGLRSDLPGQITA